MTSPLDIRPDAPGMLRTEAMDITLKFDRTGPTTGRVSWNIPRPATGCTAETQAYCGMVITVDTTSNTSTKLPKNGTVYSSDPTVDPNLFAGDSIGTSKVVGAFYQDRHTTYMDISGLRENTPYFVSGFPVDCEFRYYQPGVHAYSLDYQQDGTQPTSGTQVLVLDMENGAQPTDPTGLDANTTYSFILQRGLVPKPQRPIGSQECVPNPWKYTITVPGAQASTYQEFLDVVNTQLQTLDNPPQGPSSPNTGSYYWNATEQKLYLWDGTEHIEQPVIIQATSPSVVVDGTYWLNTTTNALSISASGVWTPVVVITNSFNPSIPECETSYWFDGTAGYTWTGNAWLRHNTYNQTVNPSSFQSPPCGSFWYNTTTFELHAWDDTLQMWIAANAIQYGTAPNMLPDGTYWFNTVSKKLNKYEFGALVEQTDARISEIEPTLLIASGTQWYNPTTQLLFVRNLANTAWVATDLIVFEADPTAITYCSNWWNTNDDKLYVWDGVHGQWVLVANFFEQGTDPTDTPAFAEGDLWYNPTAHQLYYWQNNCFKLTEYVLWATDPRASIPDGTVWHDTKNELWFVMTSGTWVPADITMSANDPAVLPAGTMWFNSANSGLQMWNGAAWISMTFSTRPLTPATSTKWYNTTTGRLMEWDGYAWVPATPLITMEFNCFGNYLFTDTSKGSLSWVHVVDVDTFSSFTKYVTFKQPSPGSDGVSSEPLYGEVGIGTDGTNDERLKLHTEIRYAFGYPTIDVELTPEQLDFAIDRAVSTLREHSSIAYTRGFFFLQINRETQRYLLTNKVSGMNKIVDILSVQRMTSAFLSSAHGAGVYGQIVLQHLYNMGTFDLLSYHIMSEYTKTMEQLFAARVTFTWNEQTRELVLHHRFPFSERMVLVDASVERTEQQLLSDRICRPWLRKWAIAEASMMLANIRGKFQTLPGAGGGVSLNASDLRQQATTDMESLMADIDDYVADTPEEWGMHSTFTFG